MKNINRQMRYVIFGIAALMLILGIFTIMPTRAQASFEWGQIIDPFCWFACDDAIEPAQIIDPFCLFACEDDEDDQYNTVYVDNQIQNPTVNISANPSNINYNDSTTISWYSNNATSCNASGGTNGWSGSKSVSGTFYTGPLTNTTTFFINCTNSAGGTNDAVTVNVDNQIQNPTVNISANPSNINYNDSTTISWYSNNATSCNASGGTNGWSGSKSVSGTFYTGSLTSDETYRITCYNNNSSANDSVVVRVDDDYNDDYNNDDNDPDVTTRSATNISTSSATLNGRVEGNGSSVRTWFEYGTGNNLGYSTSRNSYGSRSTSYSKSVSGLMPNTTYYFRAVAENSRDIAYGNILSFNTGTDLIYYPPVNNQPTVVITADQASIPFNGATSVRWYTTNATSCFASGGSVGWAGAKNIGSGSFYTGLLTSSRTYTITCSNNTGSSTDSVAINVRGQVTTTTTNTQKPTPTSLVLITSSMDRNQSIAPTLDNARPHPGDEINYTVNYQNIGTGAITGLTLRIDLPYEVDYMFSNGSNPTRSGNTLVFNLGTLKANGQGSVTTRMQVRSDASAGTNLNFPATLFYVDPSGQPQSVNANVSAQIWAEPKTDSEISLGASVIGSGFLPQNLFGWILLLVLLLILILLSRHLYGNFSSNKSEHFQEHI